ncbi:IS5 family transposase [Desulforhopalus sp. IMCC35007]|uniref:IS5 family transposase n=1 Tax=Desulforhopalus sp. IMCC35007 TaxID=2569543 RepID=UPI0010ADE295|nr:IS5 family transposase [Desulforhopalus sp. IMCC35007]TKB06000.1 IS5 family transposase [Desulforhopalus sp. IMCC35007]
MKPKKSPQQNPQADLFRAELQNMINPTHSLVKLSEVVNWDQLNQTFGESFNSEKGRPAISTRLMIALHYFKYTFDLSDEDVLHGWVENPYWQYFSGMKYFEHKLPIHPTSMTKWRNRIGEAGAEELLKQTIEAGLKLKAIKTTQLKRVNVDTTVMEKDIRFPTDARLYDRARDRLVKEAKKRKINLRQNYNRLAKRLVLKQSRYAHARQMKRARNCTKKLKTYLGRVIRDIERKCSVIDGDLSALLATSKKIHKQQRHDKNKVYSVHEPDVDCISKGKAHKRYEFGTKVSVATTSRGGWFVGALAFHNNPYDGHTLEETLEQVTKLTKSPDHVFVDRGYRGHDYTGEASVHVDKVRRGKTSNSLWRWMKRRSAVEPSIGHLKQEHRMDRNRLKGVVGDQINAILSAAGMNFRKLMKFIRGVLLLFWAMIVIQAGMPSRQPA